MTEFSCVKWTGYTPWGDSKESLLQVLSGDNPSSEPAIDTPKIAEMPASLRRRTTLLSKYVARVAYDIIAAYDGEAPLQMVLLSEEGEVQILEKLLADLHSDDPLSPMDFCNSVHNTPLGYLSIATKNHETSRTIAGGRDGVSSALLEVAMLLHQNPHQPVLLLIADELVPAIFNEEKRASHIFASGFLFYAGKQQQSHCVIDAERLQNLMQERMSVRQFVQFIDGGCQ